MGPAELRARQGGPRRRRGEVHISRRRVPRGGRLRWLQGRGDELRRLRRVGGEQHGPRPLDERRGEVVVSAGDIVLRAKRRLHGGLLADDPQGLGQRHRFPIQRLWLQRVLLRLPLQHKQLPYADARADDVDDDLARLADADANDDTSADKTLPLGQFRRYRSRPAVDLPRRRRRRVRAQRQRDVDL